MRQRDAVMPAPSVAVPARRQPLLGMAAAAFAAAGWGIASVFIKLARLPPLTLTEYRLALASGILLVALLASGHRLRFADLRLAVPGGVFLCADMACFFAAVEKTRIADAAVISSLQPALVMLAAGRLFRERIDGWDVLWTALAIAGVGAVVLGAGIPHGTGVVGDVLAIASLLAWTGYFLVSKRARPSIGALEYTFWVTVVAAVVLLPVAVISGEHLGVGHSSAWLWIVLLALVPGTGHLLINWAHRGVNVSVSSVIGASNPIFAAGGAWLVLGQGLDLAEVVCGTLAIGAICVVAGRKRPAGVSTTTEPRSSTGPR